MSLDLDQKYYAEGYQLIVGTDEAGRGCLLGPVFAAAVILPRDFNSSLINDSKQLSANKREAAFELITKNALAYAITSICPEEIDEINILNASRKAMQKAIAQLNHKYDLILTDAMKMKDYPVPVISVIHGDALSQSIAAASILAKVARDRYCEEIDKKFPLYHIAKHKGYGTKDHLEALKRYGPIKHLHRFSYAPVKACLIEKYL
ncbi:MAG: ribonuclease HII [Erysipelotrichaceae bacterium]|jgi:ribonuclease HII|nr:ribonuclease HII [Erysipelotrichaceae bacterium]